MPCETKTGWDFLTSDYTSSTCVLPLASPKIERTAIGVIIWEENGVGEVFIGDNAENHQVHYVFDHTTDVESTTKFEIMVGLEVKVYYSVETESKESEHTISILPRMVLRKYGLIQHQELIIVDSPIDLEAVSIGRNKNTEKVLVHASCSGNMKAAIVDAIVFGNRKFEPPEDSFPPCSKGELIDCWAVVSPFSLHCFEGVNNSIRYLAFQFQTDPRFCDDVAIVTKLIEDLCFEARFIHSGQAVYCPIGACHSELVSRIFIGALVKVKANGALSTSSYYWRGFDVRTCDPQTIAELRREDLNLDWPDNGTKPFPMNHSMITTPDLMDPSISLTDVQVAPKPVKSSKSRKPAPDEVWKKKYRQQGLQYKKNFECELDQETKNFERILTERRRRRRRGPLVEEPVVETNLEGLLPWQIDGEGKTVQEDARSIPFPIDKSNIPQELFERTKKENRNEAQVIARLLAPEDGIARICPPEAPKMPPDMQWRRQEMRIFGLADNFMWQFMSTFSTITEDATEEEEKELDKEPLKDGFWYRRKAPRTEKTYIVGAFLQERDVFLDCTKDHRSEEIPKESESILILSFLVNQPPCRRRLHRKKNWKKQYRDYKAQYEQWKEKNKSSIGTEAYNNYVKSFQEWERDVEKRRKALKEKAEKDDREKREEEEREKRLLEEREAEAAVAYAQSQQAYMAHHQKAIEDQHRQQAHQAAAAAAAAAAAQRQFAQQPSGAPQGLEDGAVNAEVVMREAMNVMMVAGNSTVGTTITQQPPPAQGAQASGPPPILWGNNKAPYDVRDSLFSRWEARAAPAHVKPEPHPPKVPTPCWMLIDKLKEKKMMLAPHVHLQPPPMFTQPPPPTMLAPPPV
ncbi:unnamed protein product [Caenorhabditis auriculariae]|uniref:Uncharacterized protein n=1 Tax=Caenorhabditis auriculariae TaxID=2777116 RepID=A0A8S1H7D1_9PELO|nr:unnamed protein product [Caenorhabditis auriculariae]